MADLNATANVSEVSFRFSISNISKLNGNVWSPEYSIDGARWKVFARKNVADAKPSLSLFLYCVEPDLTTNRSHVASATFELLSFKNGCKAIKREIPPFVFHHSFNDCGFREFIQWDKLFDAKHGYVKDDTINLQIQIRAESSKAEVTKFDAISKSCDDGCLSTFRATVSSIASLTAAKTPEFILRKMPSEFLLFKHSNGLGNHLQSTRLVRQVFVTDLEVKLVTSNAALNRCEKVQGEIGPKKCALSISKLISWDELLEPKNGFIKNDTITVEFKIKADFLDSVSNSNKRKAVNDHQLTDKQSKWECKICKNAINDQDISSLPCGHVFCSPCITESMKARKVCPSCDVRATQNGLRRILLQKSD